MPREVHRSTGRRIATMTMLALVATTAATVVPSLSAQADEGGPSAAHHHIEGDRHDTDAVLLSLAAKERARTRVDHSPADARRTDGDRAGDAGNVIDVAFVYPAALVFQADVGGLTGLRAKFQAMIAQTNRAFANSGVPAQLRYVGDRQVAAPTSTDLYPVYDQLTTSGDGVFDEAQQLREETHADLVSMWVSGQPSTTGVCGLGSLGGTSPTYDPEYAAWTVMFYTSCADYGLTFSHEIGHNLSGDHDSAAGYAPSGGKPYARGYTDPAHGFRTMMAYRDACTKVNIECTRLEYFSSPTVKTPQGWATGHAGADNARAVAEQAPAVANYRQSQIYPATPVVSGTLNRGKTVRAAAPGWAPGNVTFGFQWAADGVPIPGATGTELRLGKAQLRKSITVTVTGSAPYYQPVAATSAPTGPVGKKLFKKTHRPKIKGKARPGRRLHVRMKSWKPAKKVKYRFKWFRNGKRIKGATGRTYRVSRKDRGKKLVVKVTGKRRGFETERRQSKKVKVRRR